MKAGFFYSTLTQFQSPEVPRNHLCLRILNIFKNKTGSTGWHACQSKTNSGKYANNSTGFQLMLSRSSFTTQWQLLSEKIPGCIKT